MRRFWIMLLTVALALVIALPAGADKPCCDLESCGEDYTEGHPACGEDDPAPVSDDMGGYTCAEYAVAHPDWDWETFAAAETFTLVLKGGGDACIDVTAPAGVWNVDITTNGGRGVSMIVRDSFTPGDSCGGAMINSDPTGSYTLPLPDDTRTEIPSSHVNACGTAFGEWIGGTLIMDEQMLVGHPLAFIVYAGGSPKSTTTISVELPTAP